MSNYLRQAKRIVIKIGSSLLIDPVAQTIRKEWLESLIADVKNCLLSGQQVIIVSSGAISLGRQNLGLKSSTFRLSEKQALAAIGQIQLANAYQTLLEQQELKAAQVLLTLEDSENRRRYLNARHTLEALLRFNVVPIINENDTVATAEIRYGDNDRLAARVAQMIEADVLVLLSDIDGLYTADPNRKADAKLIQTVTDLTDDILQMADQPTSAYGSGGMITKLMAAKITMSSGCKMVITAGKHLHPIDRIDQTERKTWFIPKSSPRSARKNWLAQHLQVRGALTIDDGAHAALMKGKSLLAVGVLSVEGAFKKGDAVYVQSIKSQPLGRGLTSYSSTEIAQLLGKPSHQFKSLIGHHESDEIIHRDDLVLGEDL